MVRVSLPVDRCTGVPADLVVLCSAGRTFEGGFGCCGSRIREEGAEKTTLAVKLAERARSRDGVPGPMPHWLATFGDANGNPLARVNVLAHDLRLCLAQWPASEKRYEPGVLREQPAPLFERYPGRRLLTMDALYAERDLCQAIVGHGRDYLVRVKGNQPTVLAALTDGFAGEEPGEPQAETLEKSGRDRETAHPERCRTGRLHPG